MGSKRQKVIQMKKQPYRLELYYECESWDQMVAIINDNEYRADKAVWNLMPVPDAEKPKTDITDKLE